MMRIMEGEFITRPELHAESRRDYNKKISAETMFVEQQMRNKLPMNQFRLAIRRTFLIINVLTFQKQIFSRNNGAKRSQNRTSWSLMNVCEELGDIGLQ